MLTIVVLYLITLYIIHYTTLLLCVNYFLFVVLTKVFHNIKNNKINK